MKTLLACVCTALTCKDSLKLAEDFRFVQTFSSTSLWTDVVYYVLAGIFWMVAACLWVNAMRAERILDIPNPRDLEESAREQSRARGDQDGQDQEEPLPIDVPAPNYNQYNRFVCTVSFWTMTLWIHGQLVSSYFLPTVSIYTLLFGRYLLLASDIFMFMGICPSGSVMLDDDFGSEDDPYYDENGTRDGDDYQTQNTPGFIEGFKQKERQQQARAAQEMQNLQMNQHGRSSKPRMDHRNMEQNSDPEDIDVDVDVDNLEDGEDPEGYGYAEEQYGGEESNMQAYGSRNQQRNEDYEDQDYEEDV